MYFADAVQAEEPMTANGGRPPSGGLYFTALPCRNSRNFLLTLLGKQQIQRFSN